MNKKCIALNTQEYHQIIDTMTAGFSGCRSNVRVATALKVEAILGIRIGDILKLKLNNIILDGDRYRLEIKEEKTQKSRTFTVPNAIYTFLQDYCLENGLGKNERIFPISERAVQKQLKLVCDYLQLENISTHSFRKYFATQIYINNNYNIVLVQHLLQHSSPNITQRYIGISSQEIEQALQNHIYLL